MLTKLGPTGRFDYVYTTAYVGLIYVTQGCEYSTTPSDINYTDIGAGVHSAGSVTELLLPT